jgi:phosphatidylserine/phosphatidylglycerophosphate/cardiolipin synthase-like enzyme
VSSLTYDQAQVLVASVYRVLDLFSNSETELGEWAKTMDSDGNADGLMPSWFDAAERGALTRALSDCAVVRDDTTIDRYRLLEFQQAVELLPHFRAQELARRPAPKAQVVFTVPDAVVLPRDAAYLRHSLGARVCESLASAEDRVLLASPYWSDEGTDKLWDATTKARELRLAVTLAGAKRDPGAEHDHLAAMLRFAQRLADDGADVTCLEFVPPVPGAIFHAKIVCGTVGYLGSGNMTDSALGIHVEAGVPLGHVDVDQVWWLIGALQQAGLLRFVGLR